jgi:signal transduction histidine kinase/CheY-like chemotaxis protein/AraC-like DNA-binding protein
MENIPSYNELKTKCDDFQAQFIRFLKVEQDLIVTRSKLDRDLSRFKSFQTYSQKVIRANSLEEFATITIESVIETFEVECSAFYIYDRTENIMKVKAFYGIDLVLDEDWQLKSEWISTRKFLKTNNICAEQVEPASEPFGILGLASIIISPFYDEDGNLHGMLLGGISIDKKDYYDEIDEEIKASFMVFTQQMSSMLRNFEAKMYLDIRVQERTAEVIKQKQEIEKKNEQITEMDQMRTRFFTNISHEFRTPLTLILGPLEDMLTKKELTEKNRITMERMHRSASRMLALTNQLLDLSKIDSGSMKLELVESDLYRFLLIIFTTFTPLAERNNIRFKFRVPGDEFRTYYDQDKIEKIVYNLLSNAFKFTPVGGIVNTSIKIYQDRHPNVIEISVKDSGPGIPIELTKKIFDRFYQVETGARMGLSGTGIGLSLTKELVKMQHGEIFINSKPGQGAEFTVTIPLGFEHLQQEEYILREWNEINESFLTMHAVMPYDSPGYEDQFVSVGEISEMPQVLIVDDNADLRGHIIQNMEDRFLLYEAGDGKEGLIKAVEMVPDLIITDLAMPEMDGLEMCEKLKTDQRTSHIPVIILTSRASVENRIEGFGKGADDYINKPFNMQELVMRIKNLIEQRKMLRRQFSRDVRLSPKDISITSEDEKFLNRTIAIIEEHINNFDFDVSKLTDNMGVSRVQLFRKLKALTDQSPSEFIRTIRLKRAAQLFDKGFGNITEVTYQVGFNNLSYFAKCFREQFGLSPSDYAKQRP